MVISRQTFMDRMGERLDHLQVHGEDLTQLEPISDELAEYARDGVEGLEQASSLLKTTFLAHQHKQTPDYRVRNLVWQNSRLLQDVRETGQDVSPEQAEKLDQAWANAGAAIEQSGRELALASLSMGLMAGALDAVLVAVAGGRAGAAPAELRPRTNSQVAEKIVETFYNQPDKAAQRLELLERIGAGQLRQVVGFHSMSAYQQAEKMMDVNTSEAGFAKANIRRFANGYHIGLNLTLERLPEVQQRLPKEEVPEVDLTMGEDGLEIDGIPLDIAW